MNRIAALTTALLLGVAPLAMAGTHGDQQSSGISGQANSQLSEAQVKQKLQAAGYTSVTNLRKDRDGWTADAMKNGQQVALDIDKSGRIEPRARSGSSTPPAVNKDVMGHSTTAPGADTSHGGSTTQSLSVPAPGSGNTGSGSR